MKKTVQLRGSDAIQNGGTPDPVASWKSWFRSSGVRVFERARAKAIGENAVLSADPRPQGAASYSLGQFQSPQLVEGMPVWFDAWAVPATGQVVMKDMFHQWFTAQLPQNS